jgi:predicted DNA-binding transcriptional regulator AlpA
MQHYDDERDDDMMALKATCQFFGGVDRPIHYSTLYRGIAAGRYPKPVHIGPNSVRWLRSECRKARQTLIAARDDEPEAA